MMQLINFIWRFPRMESYLACVGVKKASEYEKKNLKYTFPYLCLWVCVSVSWKLITKGDIFCNGVTWDADKQRGLHTSFVAKGDIINTLPHYFIFFFSFYLPFYMSFSYNFDVLWFLRALSVSLSPPSLTFSPLFRARLLSFSDTRCLSSSLYHSISFIYASLFSLSLLITINYIYIFSLYECLCSWKSV